MNYFEAHEHYIYTRCGAAVLSVEVLIGWVGEFLDHPYFRRSTNVIWDVLGVRDAELSFADMQTFGDYLLLNRERRGGGRSSLVTDNDLIFGLFRTHEMLNQEKFDYDFRVFRDLETARTWVEEGAGQSPSSAR